MPFHPLNNPQHYLAIDLGAESGRLILGRLEKRRLSLQELHRFPNTPVRTEAGLTWNFRGLMDEIKAGFAKAVAIQPRSNSLSVTAWGVDYVLFKVWQEILEPVFHYRDARTARGVAAMHKLASREEIFAETGVQFMPLNTIYQLMSEPYPRRHAAWNALLIADAVHFLLCASARAEESAASTTGLFDPRTRKWSKKLTRLTGWPAYKLGKLVPSGRRLGPLHPSFGLASWIEVIATCSHDTACAVAAVPVPPASEAWAYLSSGTWSLMGVERTEPVFSHLCQQYNFTNEVGYGGSIRLLKNIIGLWLVQECRRVWAAAGQEYDYATLTELAAQSPPFVSLINPADPRFLAPANMPEAIAGFCRETGQPVPETPGAILRCVFESLALIYRQTLLQLELVAGTKIRRLHIVGGGSRNALLNQLTADALGIPVIAGPDEATAAGNILIQAITLKHLRSLADARAIIQDSFGTTTFQPQNSAAWLKPYDRLEQWF